jgi:hypothetical protein
MRKIGMLLVILVTGYFAGVYRNEPLMVMVVTEVLLMAVMWLFSILLRQTLSIGFASSSGEASMGDCFSCGVAIRNKGLLPVSRFRLSLSSGYEGGKKKQFESTGAFLNYMGRRGWDVATVYTDRDFKQQLILYFVLKKKITDESQVMEGIETQDSED